jgi:hypothetical protein
MKKNFWKQKKRLAKSDKPFRKKEYNELCVCHLFWIQTPPEFHCLLKNHEAKIQEQWKLPRKSVK